MNPKPMSLGLPRSGTVRLVAHSSAWATEYWLERGRILAVLGVRIQAIEHVGSTAIPGIVAKPIIDIAI
ncbi:MAG: GrpB family protein, partial [Caldilineaceae bacterium]|nr:GrpB family protein [Caldilineaceae bacterium]